MDNRISLKKLEILCLVVELGGVGRAAARLGVSQPVVTAHMRLLQDRLGVELLYRDGQHMRLTDAGEEVYRWAREVLGRGRELTRAIEGIADGRTGAVVVAASMSVGSYLLPEVLGRFAELRPDARITLHVYDAEDAQRAAESGDCDFAVVTSEAPLAGGMLHARSVAGHDLVLVASPQDDRVGAEVDVDELAALPFVCSPHGRPRRRLVEDALAEIGIVERRVVIELGHPEALKAVTRMGMGVALLLRASVQAELDVGTLREVTITGACLTVPILIVYRTDKRFSPIQSQLLDAVVESFSSSDGAALFVEQHGGLASEGSIQPRDDALAAG
jgi:DNA-binding transcriptional LysR family regulator